MIKYDCYIASGWFNEAQANDLKNIKNLLDKLNIKYFSPKDEIVCKPNDSLEQLDIIFQGNLNAISDSKFLIVNTRDKDIGTIWEAGYAFRDNKPIIYFCEGLVGKFNVMLSRSGVAVATNLTELELHVKNLNANISYRCDYTGLSE